MSQSPTVVKCEIIFDQHACCLFVTLSDGQRSCIDRWYPDERSSHFGADEAIGKQLPELEELFFERDTAFIRSWVDE